MRLRAMVGVALSCTAVLAGSGCGRKDPPAESTADKAKTLRTQLVGQWERQWEYGPVGYQRILKPDGSAILREFRAAPGSAPAAAAGAGGPTMYHRLYKADLPLFREYAATWSVQGGDILYQVALPNGDPLRMRYKIERLTTTELVESTTGADGKVESKFTRAAAGATRGPVPEGSTRPAAVGP